MKDACLSLAAGALALSTAMPAFAQTVDFNDLHSDSTYLISSRVTSGGYSFGVNPGHRFLIWSTEYPLFDADPDGAALGLQDGGAIVDVAKVGGGAFRLESIEMDDIYNGGYSMYGNYGGDVQFRFNLAGGGSVTQKVTIDGAPGWERFNFGAMSLSSFTMTSVSTRFGLFQVDNMVTGPVEDDRSLAAVPEPTAWAMMLMGFGILGAALRRPSPAVITHHARDAVPLDQGVVPI